MGGRQRVVLGLVAILLVAAGGLVWLGIPDPVYMDSIESPAAAGVKSANPSVLASNKTQSPANTGADPKTVDRTRLLVTDDYKWTVRMRAFRGRDQRFPGARLRALVYSGFEAVGEPHTSILTCNDDGEATWRLPAPTETVTVQVRSADTEVVAREVSSVVPMGEAAPLLKVHLLPLDHILLGVVMTQEGKPVPKARVTWAQSVPPIYTDEQGRLRLRVSSAHGPLAYYVVAPGHSRFQEVLHLDGPGTTNVEVRLKPGFRAFGKVTDTEGRPLEGVQVSTFWFRYTGERTLTDAEGNYELDTLDIDRTHHYVVATLEGYARVQARAKGTGSEGRIDVTMKRAAIITGTVFGPDGRPVAGAMVGVSRGSRPRGTGTVVTREDGRFTLQHQPKGKHYLWTHKRGLAMDRRRINPSGEGTAVNLQVYLQPGHFVAGRVIDGEGRAIAGARIYAFLDGGSAWLGIDETTDADGRYRLEDLPAQPQKQKRRMSLSVSASGHVSQRKRDLTLDSEDVDIVLQRAMVLRGRVVDGHTGAPLQDFRIRVLSGRGLSWMGRGQRFQNTDGYWETTGQRIKPGTNFDLEAVAPGYAPTVLQKVTAVPDLAPEVTLFKLFPGVVLSGEILDQATGGPVAGAKITLLRPGQRRVQRGRNIGNNERSSADGSFRFEHVAPGSLLLKIEHAGRPPFLHGPLIVPTAGTMDRVIVLLGTGGRIDGVLTDPASNPLAKVTVILTPGPMAQRQLRLRRKTTRTDATGRFRFDGLVNTDYVLNASSEERDGVTLVFQTAVRVRGDGPTQVMLGLNGPCSVTGTVGFLGSPGSGVRVQLHRTSGLAGVRVTFAAPVKSGRFTVCGLPEGNYNFSTIYRLDGKRRSHSGPRHVVVKSGTDSQVSIQIPPQQPGR